MGPAVPALPGAPVRLDLPPREYARVAGHARPADPISAPGVRERHPPTLARDGDGDGVAAELPFGWISDVWARGLGTCWDRFCLAAGPAGAGWELSAVGPELGAPEPVMLSRPAAG